MTIEFFVGLDLGQTTDPSAVAVLERRGGAMPTYSLRHLQRFPLGTPYTTVATAVVKLTQTPPLRGRCALEVDQTGVGRPVVELLRQLPAVPFLVPITITGGFRGTRASDSWHVPKRDLVGGLQAAVQARRLLIAGGLCDADTLMTEMANFRVAITPTAQETFGAARAGQHDDLVLAVALAVFTADRFPHMGRVPSDGSSTGNTPQGAFAS